MSRRSGCRRLRAVRSAKLVSSAGEAGQWCWQKLVRTLAIRTAGNAEAIARLTKVSPVAWQNVNLFGAFDFSDSEVDVDLSAIAAIVGNPLLWGVVESNLEGELFEE